MTKWTEEKTYRSQPEKSRFFCVLNQLEKVTILKTNVHYPYQWVMSFRGITYPLNLDAITAPDVVKETALRMVVDLLERDLRITNVLLDKAQAAIDKGG